MLRAELRRSTTTTPPEIQCWTSPCSTSSLSTGGWRPTWTSWTDGRTWSPIGWSQVSVSLWSCPASLYADYVVFLSGWCASVWKLKKEVDEDGGDTVQDVLRGNDLLCRRLGVLVNSTCSVPVACNNTFIIIKVIVTSHVTAFSVSVGQIKLPRSAESPEINLCSGSTEMKTRWWRTDSGHQSVEGWCR